MLTCLKSFCSWNPAYRRSRFLNTLITHYVELCSSRTKYRDSIRSNKLTFDIINIFGKDAHHPADDGVVFSDLNNWHSSFLSRLACRLSADQFPHHRRCVMRSDDTSWISVCAGTMILLLSVRKQTSLSIEYKWVYLGKNISFLFEIGVRRMRRVDVQLFEIKYQWVHLERYEIQINSSCNCPTQEK